MKPSFKKVASRRLTLLGVKQRDSGKNVKMKDCYMMVCERTKSEDLDVIATEQMMQCYLF